MTRFVTVVAILVALVSTTAWAADDPKQQAAEQDLQQLEGTWRIVSITVNGNEVTGAEAKKFTVVNGADNTWSLRSEGQEISSGANSLDPSQSPKAIQFTITQGGGQGQTHQGIYQLEQDSRMLCFAPPGKARPAEFAAPAGSGHVLVKFERVQ